MKAQGWEGRSDQLCLLTTKALVLTERFCSLLFPLLLPRCLSHFWAQGYRQLWGFFRCDVRFVLSSLGACDHKNVSRREQWQRMQRVNESTQNCVFYLGGCCVPIFLTGNAEYIKYSGILQYMYVSICAQSCPTQRSYGLQPARLHCPWNSPGKHTGVGCHFLLQGVFLIQGWNLRLLHCRQMLLCWATREAHIVVYQC